LFDRPPLETAGRRGTPRITPPTQGGSFATVEGVGLRVKLRGRRGTLGHSTYQITADIYAHGAPELEKVPADAR